MCSLIIQPQCAVVTLKHSETTSGSLEEHCRVLVTFRPQGNKVCRYVHKKLAFSALGGLIKCAGILHATKSLFPFKGGGAHSRTAAQASSRGAVITHDCDALTKAKLAPTPAPGAPILSTEYGVIAPQQLIAIQPFRAVAGALHQGKGATSQGEATA